MIFSPTLTNYSCLNQFEILAYNKNLNEGVQNFSLVHFQQLAGANFGQVCITKLHSLIRPITLCRTQFWSSLYRTALPINKPNYYMSEPVLVKLYHIA